ncbi:MAG: serine/threonine-protein kinase [Ilumatobacteraceae bacterium]
MEINGFSNLEVLGRGGFSVVYRAHQNAQSRDVAIKVLNVDMQDEAQRARFERECSATGKLGSHPNVMTVYESGYSTDGKPYIAMELCEGGSLADRIAQSGPLPLDEALHVTIKIAGAVETAHRAGITHRDIKPENMLVTAYGDVVLADFGISAFDQVRSGTATGGAFTLSHVPPEVLQGNTSEVPGDVYSLASSLFRLLSGNPPFADDSTPIAVAVSKTMNDPVPELAGVPKSLNKVLAKAMAKTPASRYASAMSFAETLQEVQREVGIAPTDPVASSSSVRAAEPIRPSAMNTSSGSGVRLPTVEAASVVSKSSTGKVAALIAVAVLFVGGGGVFAFQQFGGGEEERAATEVIDTTTTVTTAVARPMSTNSTETTLQPGAPDAAVSTTVPKKKQVVATTATTATTAAPPIPTTTVAAAPATTAAPVITTTVAPKTPVSIPLVTIPTLTISPNVIGALTCSSFATCAQKLFDAWKAGNRETAKIYASDFAVDIMFASPYSSASTGWAATVTKQTDYIWYVSSTRSTRPTKFSFFFNNKQTDFKVQSVVVS